jgi:molybdenum cofactor cytidylyltransferase
VTGVEPGTRNPEPAVYALVLAAGSGRRFGGGKLLANLRGRPLVAHAASAVGEAIAAGTLAGGVAVMPPGLPGLARELAEGGLQLVENPDAQEGLSGSLRLGLDRLSRPDGPRAAGALIVLADQPALRAGVIARLIEEWRRDRRSVRPRYADHPEAPGHPVLLDRSLWPLAAELSGDQGLRDLLESAAMSLVDVPGTNPDVDTREDLDRLEKGG